MLQGARFLFGLRLLREGFAYVLFATAAVQRLANIVIAEEGIYSAYATLIFLPVERQSALHHLAEG